MLIKNLRHTKTKIAVKSLLFFLIFICTEAKSQNYFKFYAPNYERIIQSVGYRGGFGVIIPHRESMIHLVTGHVVSNEIYFEKCGKKREWNRKYNYPTCGINLYYGYLANPDVLGNAFAIDYYTNLHFIKKKMFIFDLRLASGFGYLTKVFDPDINNQNVAIGSKLNISVGASFDFKYQITREWQIATGLSLKHFSNGSFSTPNLGINIPVWMVGIKKNINHQYVGNINLPKDTLNSLREQHRKYNRYSALIGIGVKEIYPAGGKKFGTYSLQLNAIHYRNLRSGFTAGMDMIHNVALYQFAIQNDTLTEVNQGKFTQFTFNIGYVQTFDKFELFLQNGYYLVNRFDKDGDWYQRLGGRYYLNNKMAFHFALKTHFAKADYFEIGWGYSFTKAKRTRVYE